MSLNRHRQPFDGDSDEDMMILMEETADLVLSEAHSPDPDRAVIAKLSEAVEVLATALEARARRGGGYYKPQDIYQWVGLSRQTINLIGAQVH